MFYKISILEIYTVFVTSLFFVKFNCKKIFNIKMYPTQFAPQRYGEAYQGDVLTAQQIRDAQGAQTYSVNFRMRFSTTTGEDIGVIGDLPELGNWDPKKCLKLKWFQDHVWETEVPLVTNRPYFKYKYVQYNPATQIEDGMDRLAELRLLPEIKNRGVTQRQQAGALTHAIVQSQSIKQVELNDEWQAFRAHFTTWHTQDVTMRISGSRPELGDWGKGSGHLVMRRAPNSRTWMHNQYGTPMRPYECIVTIKHGR